MRHIALLVCCVALITAAFFIFMRVTEAQNASYEDGRISVGSQEISVLVSDDRSERIRGLSGRQAFQTDQEGMLFVFDQKADHGIWMKDMLFSIDIAWLNGSGEVLHVEAGVHPDTYPDQTFHADSVQVLYVLEMNESAFKELGIEVGSQLEL